MKSIEILEKDPRGIMNSHQLAEFFGVVRQTIIKWRVHNPEFPKGWKIGSQYYWENREILDYLKKIREES